MDWKPTAELKTLQSRAEILKIIRAFFYARDYLEVETPLLAQGGSCDPGLHSLSANVAIPGGLEKRYFQTSPEFHMKRLLAAGSGNIFQLCKAFRNEEYGRRHNPEFTMLEWYRVGITHLELMAEVDVFLQEILELKASEFLSYSDVFQKYCDINPHSATIDELSQRAKACGAHVQGDLQKDDYLDLLMTHCIEQNLGLENRPTCIYDFPASQATLARVRDDGAVKVTERFEFYIDGLELANGFHELTDAEEQRVRFEKDNTERAKRGLDDVKWDRNLIDALEHGLPDCAGVALGIDRFMMLALGEHDIAKVMSFSHVNA